MIQSKVKQKVFSDLLEKLQINPAKEKRNAKKFYEWMKYRVKHPYADNSDAMKVAIQSIIEY